MELVKQESMSDYLQTSFNELSEVGFYFGVCEFQLFTVWLFIKPTLLTASIQLFVLTRRLTFFALQFSFVVIQV